MCVGGWAWHTHYFNLLIKRGGHKKCAQITLTCDLDGVVAGVARGCQRPDVRVGVGVGVGAGTRVRNGASTIPQLPFTFYDNFTFTKPMIVGGTGAGGGVCGVLQGSECACIACVTILRGICV